MEKRKKRLLAVPAVLISMFLASALYSHCQIPCGIYDDPARLKIIAEHITTIEKSMNEINTLASESGKNINQLVRWVDNKDNHADQLSEIVTYYFMAQRINPVEKTDTEIYPRYVKQLTLLHEMLITSMKCKQTTDLENVKKLRQLLDDFEKAYVNK